MEPEKKQRNHDFLWFLLVFTALFCSFYHKTLVSGFDLLPGDAGDARFNILIAEHWIEYWKGELGFGETRFFYPFGNAMGFSDLSILFAWMEIPFRWMGLDALRATQIVFFLIHFIGAGSCFYLLRKLLKLRFMPSVIGMMVICFGNPVLQKIYHTQFYTYFLLPLLCCLLICYCRCTEKYPRWKRMAFLSGAFFIFLLILYTAYYTAFFTAFFSVAFAFGLAVAFIARQNWKDLKALRNWFRIRMVDFGIL